MSTETQNADLSSLRIRREGDENPPARGSRKAFRIGGLILLVVVVAVVAYRTFNKGATEVELATVSLTYPSQANAVLTASGYVVAQQKAAVASKGTGRLVYLGVEEGDRVRKGEVIARLEDQDVIAALDKAKADMAVAQADSFDATRSLERQQALFKSGLASKADLDAAEARFHRVKASIESAAAAVHSAEVGLENTRIRAPFDGTVLTKDANVGEVVAPFAAAANSRAAVVSMADMSSLQIEADVSESNITRVNVGQECEIVLDAYPEKHYRGHIHKIVPTADRSKATVLTKVAFDDKDDRVLPEMSAKVTFLSKGSGESQAGTPPILTIPSMAVVTREGKLVALLVRDGVITEVPVKTGRTFGSGTEILEGLQQGDRVVARPDASLSTGSKVTAKTG